MSDLANTVITTASEQKSQQNQRKATVVRTCGEEHYAKFARSDSAFGEWQATAYFVTDPELAYISQLRFKLIFGNPLQPNSSSGTGGGGVVPIPSGAGVLLPTTFDKTTILSAQDFYNLLYSNGVDMDSNFGLQCWDAADFFWENMAGQKLDWDTQGGTNYAVSTVWTDPYWRNYNTIGGKFQLITNPEDVKAGDWCVFTAPAVSEVYGHIAMALASVKDGQGNYYPSYIQSRTMPYLGQNQGGIAYQSGGSFSNVAYIGTDTTAGWLGAFRYVDSPFARDNVKF